MLPPAHRVRSSQELTAVLRRGVRGSGGPRDPRGPGSGRPLLTVHLLPAAEPQAGAPARAGLVVSKAVGGSVVRHRTSRRLRHLLRPHLLGPTADVPAGAALVVRAAPAAGTATSAQLGAALDTAVRTALDRCARTGGPS